MVLSISTLQLFHSALFHLMLNSHLNKTLSCIAVTPSLPERLSALQSLECHRERRRMTTKEIPIQCKTELCNDIQALPEQASF